MLYLCMCDRAGARTQDPLLKREMLYQLSYQVNKNNIDFLIVRVICAHDWSRTSTPLRAQPPQGCVSTNFTTWALKLVTKKFKIKKNY